MSEKKQPRLALITFYGYEALGVRALHAFLRAKGCDVVVLFFRDHALNEMVPLTDEELGRIVAKVREVGADFVGLSLFSGMYPDAVRLTERLKAELGLLVIWGGYHPTVAPEECLRTADIVCIGEGEYPLWELYQRLAQGESYEDIANLWVRGEGRVVRNALRPLIQNLDELPFFDYSDEGKHYYDGGSWHAGDPFWQQGGRGKFLRTHYIIQTSRGCPFGCAYCSNSIFRQITAGKGSYVRQRSVSSIMAQLTYARQVFPEMKKVHFFDEVLVLDRAWLREFAVAYKTQVGLPFKCNLHPNLIDEEIIGLLVEAGLDDLMVGIESGSERVRREIFQRPVSTAQLERVVQIIHKAGLTPSYNLIVDNPYEREADKEESFDFLYRIPRPYNLRLFSLTHLPGTALTQRALADGLITAEQVEGQARKMLEQWRASLGRGAPSKEALFWNSVLSLLPKRFIPKRLIRWLYRSRFLRQHPGLVALLARTANALRKAVGGLVWLAQGRIDWAYIRERWRGSIRVAR